MGKEGWDARMGGGGGGTSKEHQDTSCAHIGAMLAPRKFSISPPPKKNKDSLNIFLKLPISHLSFFCVWPEIMLQQAVWEAA